MIKCLALLKRRNGMSHQEFVDYYEKQHVQFAGPLLAEAVHYARVYFQPQSATPSSFANDWAENSGSFDCATELWFDNVEDMKASLARLSSPRNAATIIQDEEQFLDRSCTQFYIIEQECKSDQPLPFYAGQRYGKSLAF